MMDTPLNLLSKKFTNNGTRSAIHVPSIQALHEYLNSPNRLLNTH